LEQRALRWGEKNVNATMAEETLFVDQIYREYRRLVDAFHYLIVVEHNPQSLLLKLITNRIPLLGV